MSTIQPTRCTMAKGAAWSIPAVMTAASAPALAVSGLPPKLDTYGRVTFNESFTGTNLDGSNAVKIYSTLNGSNSPGQGICVENTTPTTTLTNVTQTFWLASSGLRFTRSSTYGSACWSALSLDSSRSSVYGPGGYTYYPYTTSYTCPISPVSGTTCLPTFAFQAQNNFAPADIYAGYSGSFYASTKITINGTVVTAPGNPGGPYPMS